MRYEPQGNTTPTLRPLSRGARWVLAGLRIYVLLMVLLFVYKFSTVLHPR